MKKIYNTPNMKVAMLDTTDILLANSDLNGEPQTTGFDPNGAGDGTAGLARENQTLWDQEW